MYQLDLFVDTYLPSLITMSYKPSQHQQLFTVSNSTPKHYSFPLYESASQMPSALCWLENITTLPSSKGRISRLS